MFTEKMLFMVDKSDIQFKILYWYIKMEYDVCSFVMFFIKWPKYDCKHIIFGCLSYLTFLVECGFHLIKYIGMHICRRIGTFRNMLIQIHTKLLKNHFHQISYMLNIICLQYLIPSVCFKKFHIFFAMLTYVYFKRRTGLHIDDLLSNFYANWHTFNRVISLGGLYSHCCIHVHYYKLFSWIKCSLSHVCITSKCIWISINTKSF